MSQPDEEKPDEKTLELIEKLIRDKLSVRVREGRDYDWGDRKTVKVEVALFWDGDEISSDYCSFSL